MKITKKTSIAEITEKYPEIGEVLMEDYGFHCVGCFGAEMETIADGALVHGMNVKETTEMIKTLNQLVEDIEANGQD
jgi:hydroxylamine reductase